MLASMAQEVIFLDIVGDQEIAALIPRVAAVGLNRIAVVSRPGRVVQLPPVIAGTRVVLTPFGGGRTLIELE
jgi:hypothetical protein